MGGWADDCRTAIAWHPLARDNDIHSSADASARPFNSDVAGRKATSVFVSVVTRILLLVTTARPAHLLAEEDRVSAYHTDTASGHEGLYRHGTPKTSV